jgi:WD40 repeat protein
MCLRWSPKDDFLASSSDDGSVIIWQLERSMADRKQLMKIADEISSSAFDSINIEKYKVVKKLTSSIRCPNLRMPWDNVKL